MTTEKHVKHVDVDTVMSWHPCAGYTRQKVARLISGGHGWTRISAKRVLSLDIPAADRVWAVLHKELLLDSEMRLCACAFAADVLHYFEDRYPSDTRPRNAIIARLEYELGERDEITLQIARAAAWDAEIKWQRNHLKKLMDKLFGKGVQI